jgi:hypothetical protein
MVTLFDTLDELIDAKNVNKIRPRSHEELRSFVMFFTMSLVVFCFLIALLCSGAYISHKLHKRKTKRKVMWNGMNNKIAKRANELSTIREENSE